MRLRNGTEITITLAILQITLGSLPGHHINGKIMAQLVEDTAHRLHRFTSKTASSDQLVRRREIGIEP